jgi:hypothetical protein
MHTFSGVFSERKREREPFAAHMKEPFTHTHFLSAVSLLRLLSQHQNPMYQLLLLLLSTHT